MKEEEGLFKEVSEPWATRSLSQSMQDGRQCTAESVVRCVQKGGHMLVEEQPGCTVGPRPLVSVGWMRELH